ncbi:hypothetical protein MsAg5_11650 [Methanosarcinaceae archaeon Ag5]|uniref:Uncharacterized protein n=1 Tax=Methanolapillus africanus TaxID=3028297 RepID=A0AAE4MKG1_9EURY|nr:hypothetical protein [Methanosarcinaceae archaeon Ag5]
MTFEANQINKSFMINDDYFCCKPPFQALVRKYLSSLAECFAGMLKCGTSIEFVF